MAAFNASQLLLCVMTSGRSQSLMRLLHSLETADYGGDRVNLLISIDVPAEPPSKPDDQVLQGSERFEWTHGRKTVRPAERHLGLYAHWTTIWQPMSDDEWAVILEDDLEVSPLFYHWLRESRPYVARRPKEIGAVTLQRMTFVPWKKGKKGAMPPRNGNRPFLYKQCGSWGFAPTARAWRRFLLWAKYIEDRANRLGDHVPTLPEHQLDTWFWAKRDRSHMWTLHWTVFSHIEGLYTLCANAPGKKTFATNWAEKGAHFRSAKSIGKPDFSIVTEWDKDAFGLGGAALEKYSFAALNVDKLDTGPSDRSGHWRANPARGG